MSDKKLYRLLPGKKHGGGAGPRLEAGGTIELTERQALAWADKFELVGEVAGVSPATPETSAQSPAPAASDIDDDLEDIAVELVKSSKATELIARIGEAEADEVQAIAEAEAAGKGRATVLRAADDRLAELEA
jgi:hypothetical protein